MADIQYLNYGDQQIEQQALLNTLANQVQNYVAGQPWSAKRKEKFMSAYADIMNRGIQGANSNTGVWQIKIGGTPIEYQSNKDKEMYEEAAYFIQQQMAKLSKSSTVKEEEKSDLPIFSNEQFLSDITKNINNDKFGGLSEGFKTSDWNEFDKRDSTGKRGRTERASILASQLEKYRDSLSEEKYNFKDSPFGSLNEFKNRLNLAISALQSSDETDDKEALQRIGIRESDWFNNGLGDPSGKTFKLEDGTEWSPTYGDLIEYNQKLEKQKQAEKAAAEKALAANRFAGTRRYNISGYNGTPITDQKSIDSLTSKLSTFQKLNADDLSKLTWAFKHSGANLEDLSKEEFLRMPAQYRRAGRLKKISELPGIYYDTIGGGLVQPYNNDQTQLSLLDISQQSQEKAKQKKEASMNTPIGNIESLGELTPEMKKELEAIAWDIASIVNPEAFTGSAMALYASNLRDKANPNRSAFEKWFDRGTAALGGIQGFGDLLVTGKVGYRLYQLGKSIGSVTKFAGMLGAGFGAIGAWNARDSIMKITHPSSLTPQDIENISYGLMGLIGLKSFSTARNKQVIGKQANPTITEHNISIIDKNGKSHKIKVDEATAKEVNSSYKLGSKKSDVDAKVFNHEKVKEAVKEYNNQHPTEKLELEGASIESSSKLGRVTGKDAVKPEQVKNPNAPKYEPVGTRYWFNPGYIPTGGRLGWQRRAWENAAPEKSSRGIIERIKEFWNPTPKVINEGNPSTNTTNAAPTNITPTNTPTRSNTRPKPSSLLTKVESQELQSTMRGKNFSTNTPMLEQAVSVKGFGDIYFQDAKNGKQTLTFELPGGQKFEVTSSVGNKEENLKLLRKTMKNIDSNLPKKQKSRIKLEVIRKLKAIGALKQGGKITDSQIDNFLKRYK